MSTLRHAPAFGPYTVRCTLKAEFVPPQVCTQSLIFDQVYSLPAGTVQVISANVSAHARTASGSQRMPAYS